MWNKEITMENTNLRDKLIEVFNRISLYHSSDCSDFVCKLSYKYRDYMNSQRSNTDIIIKIDFKQFNEINDYVWQLIGLNGDKCLMIFLNTEDEDDFTFYKLVWKY